MDDRTRQAILTRYPGVSAARMAQLWKRSVPPREKVSIDIAGTAVSIMDDWEAAIFGESHTACLAALCQIHTFLEDSLGAGVTMRMLSPYAARGEDPLGKLIRAEKRRELAIKAAIALGGVLAGALARQLAHIVLS